MEVRYLKQGEHKFKAYGYKVVVPDELSYIIRINAKWQGEEENMRFALFTTGQWNDFSESEEESQEFAFGGDFHNHINDSVLIQDLFLACTSWESPKLNSWLNAYKGSELVASLICDKEKKEFEACFEVLTEEKRAEEVIKSFSEEFLKTSEIEKALENKDLMTAKHKFAEYFRNRTAPMFSVQECSEEDIKIADMACAHIFQPKPIVHNPEKIEPFDWKADPMDYSQWTIAWNRHLHWSSLARAYVAKKEECYAQEFAFELCQWLKEIPIFIDKGVSFIIGTVYEPGRLSHFLDAGIRLGEPWWESFEVFRKSKSITADVMVHFLDGVITQADYIADFRAGDTLGNWGAAATAGLLVAAVMLPEHKNAAKWKEIAFKRIQEILDVQFYPDGAQIELTPTYQCGAVEHVVSAIKIAKANGVALDIDIERFEKIFEYLLKISTPNRTSPAFNDSSWKPLAQVFKLAYSLFDKRDDFLWFADEGKSGNVPREKSLFLPYAGYAIMRTGYGENDVYTAFDVGPHGFSHQHEDKLNFVITYGKTTLLTEGGVYNYDYSPHHLYTLSSRAHNVILVDGMPQRRAEKKETHTTTTPIDAGWTSNSEFDYAKGIYSDGFSDGKNYVNVVHEREIKFEKQLNRWQVCDTLIPDNDKEHSYKALFHFDTEEITYVSSENKIIVKRDGKTLTLMPREKLPFSVEIINGVTNPEVQGWARLDSGEVVPRPAVVFAWECKGKNSVVWDICVE